MSVALVNYADQLVYTAGTGGWYSQFDALGTYQPTVGNFVVFCFENAVLPTSPPAGWQSASSIAIAKVWAPSDSTTIPVQPGVQGAYVAYEFSGVDSTRVFGSKGIDVYQPHSETGGFIDPSRDVFFGPVTASDNTWYAITALVETTGFAHPIGHVTPYTNGFVYDGFASFAGAVISSHGGIQPAGTVSAGTTLFGDWSVGEGWAGFLMLLGPTPPATNSVRITQTLVEALYIPLPPSSTMPAISNSDYVYSTEIFF